MQTDDQPTSSEDEFALRLAWPEPDGETTRPAPRSAPVGVPAPAGAVGEPGRAELRVELVALRGAVEALSDQLQLRQLRAAVDELRGDVTGLRRAVLEWPELEQVSSDIVGLRGDMSALVESSGAAALAPLVEEVALLRTEMTALRRRVGLRADGGGAGMDEAQLEEVAEAVADRVAAQLRASGARSGRRR